MQLKSIFSILFIIVIGGGYLFIQFDETLNYEPTIATVTRVETTCYLEKKKRGTITKTTTRTDKGDCEFMASIKEIQPEYHDFYMIRHAYITFEYISPVDGKRYSGKQVKAWAPSIPLIQPGDDFPILAHKEDPARTIRN